MSAAAVDQGVIDKTVTADPRAARRWGWWSVVEHRVLLIRHYFVTMIITGIGSPFMYLLGLGAGLGVLVDRGEGIEGVPYLTFVAPALVMASVMQIASQENTFGVFGGFRWSNTFTAMRLTPVSPAQMALGMQASVLVRMLVGLGFYLVALLVFGIGRPWGVVAMLPIGILLSLAVGFAVMSWVATQKDDRGQLSFVERFVVVPLTLFSGSYFPLETLPLYLRPLGWLSPLWHAAELSRAVLYGAPMTPWMALVHVGFLAAVAGVGALLSVRAFRGRLDQ